MSQHIPEKFGNYKNTATYKNADKNKKALIERWKREQNLKDEQAHMLLALDDIKNLSKEEKKASNKTAETVCITAMLIFFAAYISTSRPMLIMASCMIILSVITYVTGIFNPIANSQRAIRKYLKKYPQALRFDKWLETNK